MQVPWIMEVVEFVIKVLAASRESVEVLHGSVRGRVEGGLVAAEVVEAFIAGALGTSIQAARRSRAAGAVEDAPDLVYAEVSGSS